MSKDDSVVILWIALAAARSIFVWHYNRIKIRHLCAVLAWALGSDDRKIGSDDILNVQDGPTREALRLVKQAMYIVLIGEIVDNVACFRLQVQARSLSNAMSVYRWVVSDKKCGWVLQGGLRMHWAGGNATGMQCLPRGTLIGSTA